MYDINTELLPLECDTSVALRIYFHRFVGFLAVFSAAAIPVDFLLLYFRSQNLISVSFDIVLWLSTAYLIVAAPVLVYFAWAHRGLEDVLRDMTLFEKMLALSKERLQTAKDSRGSDLTIEGVEIESEELEELEHLISVMNEKTSRLLFQAQDVKRRMDELNQGIIILRTSSQKTTKTAQPLGSQASN